MEILEKLEAKKLRLKELFGDLSSQKPYKLLKNLHVEIGLMEELFTLKEQIEIINRVFESNISYHAYFQFFTKYIKNQKQKKEQKPQRNKKEEVTLEEPRTETIKDDEKSPSPINEEIVAEKEDIFKLKPINKNNGLKVADKTNYK